jgi:transposase
MTLLSIQFSLQYSFSITCSSAFVHTSKQKKTPVVYKTDKIANLHVHEVSRTPFDTELNPIELIWAQVKGFVAKNNTIFRLKVAQNAVLCKIVLENSFFLTKIWTHRIFCFNIVITCII